MTRRSITWLGTIGLIAVVVGTGCGENAAEPDACSRGVDARAWRGAVDQRQGEGDVIVRCRSLNGKTPQQVKRLLGAPAEKEPTMWLYVTGPVRGWHIDDEFLQITFADGRVQTARLVQG